MFPVWSFIGLLLIGLLVDAVFDVTDNFHGRFKRNPTVMQDLDDRGYRANNVCLFDKSFLLHPPFDLVHAIYSFYPYVKIIS